MLMFNSAHGRVAPELLKGAAEYAVLAIGLGGIGGRPGKDGLACVAFPSGIGGIPIEIIEGQCPLWFEEKQFLPNSGGDGEWRGGLSQRFLVKNREATPFTISAATFDRIKNAAQGRDGGKPGSLGVARLGSGANLPDKGIHLVPAGDSLIVELPGGGGFGEPSKRKPELRAADRKAGVVT
jgi:N-methylhydantoinase B